MAFILKGVNMNKRQWKKHLKKRKLNWEAVKKRLKVNEWFSNIAFQNLFERMPSEIIGDDCGIKIRMPMRFKMRELGSDKKAKGVRK